MDYGIDVSVHTDLTDNSYWSPTLFAPKPPPPPDDPRNYDALLMAALTAPLIADHVTYSHTSKLRLRANGLTPFQRYRLEILSAGRASETGAQPAPDFEDVADPDGRVAWAAALARQEHHGDPALLGYTEAALPDDYESRGIDPELDDALAGYIAGHAIDPLASGVPVRQIAHGRHRKPVMPHLEVRPAAVAQAFDPAHAAPPETLFHQSHERDFPRAADDIAAVRAASSFPETQFLGIAKPLARTSIRKKAAPPPPPPPPPAPHATVTRPQAGAGTFVSLGQSITAQRLGR